MRTWAKDKRYSMKEDIQLVNDWKKCLTSSAIKEMQINTTMRNHYTPIWTAKIKTRVITKCWKGC